MTTTIRRTPTRFDYYEWCAQTPELQARFLDAVHGGGAVHLCEDFCGPASIARAWALLGGGRTGEGIDVDPEPLAHARLRAREQKLKGSRFITTCADVLKTTRKAEIIAAFNFALCELHDRSRLLSYLKRVKARLGRGGIFVADLYGGVSAFSRGKRIARVSTPAGVTDYTWQQREANPLTGMVQNAMHFAPHKKTPLRNAFEYDWRLWGVPEVRDAMLDAGFVSTEVHVSYGDAIDQDGSLLLEPVNDQIDLDDDYIAYMVARTRSHPALKRGPAVIDD